mmetsp:Transcript_19425/g.56386  ORF Transcript_19425/g.56386 Transcript_19425/m.56386 type:complete len:287 (-) Transcript_19425:52-912(-)
MPTSRARYLPLGWGFTTEKDVFRSIGLLLLSWGICVYLPERMPRMRFSRPAQLSSDCSLRALIIALVQAPPAPPGPASAGRPKEAVFCTSAEVCSSMQPENMMTFAGITSVALEAKAPGSLGPLPGPKPLIARAWRWKAFFSFAARAPSPTCSAQAQRPEVTHISQVRFQSSAATPAGGAGGPPPVPGSDLRISAAACWPVARAMSFSCWQPASSRTPMPFSSPKLSSISACCASSPAASSPASRAMDMASLANSGGYADMGASPGPARVPAGASAGAAAGGGASP